MIQQLAGIELGPFASVNDTFGSPNSMAAKISDLLKLLIDGKLVLFGEDSMPSKPTRVEPSRIRVDSIRQDSGTGYNDALNSCERWADVMCDATTEAGNCAINAEIEQGEMGHKLNLLLSHLRAWPMLELCPKRVVSESDATLDTDLRKRNGPSHTKNDASQNDGFQVVKNHNAKGKQHAKPTGFKPKTFVYPSVSKPSESGTSKKHGSEGINGATTLKKDTTNMASSFNIKGPMNDINLVTLTNYFEALKENDNICKNVGTSVDRKVGNTVNEAENVVEDSDSDVEVAYDETAEFMASGGANDASLYYLRPTLSAKM
ncbi:hypothetical protein Tco_0538533 [Tanacetum coccineum]